MATTFERPDCDDPTVATRYTRVAIALHWLIALAIAYNLASGLFRASLPAGFFAFHISSGLTILLLSVARVGWRLTHKPPPKLPMQRWERWLAGTVHFLLYAAMLFVPWTGWVMISASAPAGSAGAAYAMQLRAAEAAAEGRPPPAPRKPPMFWGIAPVPLIGPVSDLSREPKGVPEQRAFRDRMEVVHALVAWTLLFLLFLHVGGALKHQFLDRQPELWRMGLDAAGPVDAHPFVVRSCRTFGRLADGGGTVRWSTRA